MFYIRTVAFVFGLGGCFLVGGCDQSDDSLGVANRQENAQPTGKTTGETNFDQPSGMHRVNGSPVSATLTLEPNRVKRGNEVTLTVKLEIEPLWEVRALGNHLGATATRLELEVPDNIAVKSDWQAPQAIRSNAPDGHSVYVDEAVFSRKMRVNPDSSAGHLPVKCRLFYQVCNDRQCLEPAALEFAAILNVE